MSVVTVWFDMHFPWYVYSSQRNNKLMTNEQNTLLISPPPVTSDTVMEVIRSITSSDNQGGPLLEAVVNDVETSLDEIEFR